MAAVKKSSGSGGGSSIMKKMSQWAWGKIFKKSLLVIALMLLGGLLFNLDRMGNTGITMLKYKDFLPGFVIKMLPGGSAVYGRAVPDQILEGQVIEVYDGDTVTLLTTNAVGDEKKYRIRLFGIDAPESEQDYGTDSRDALREKILGKDVKVIVVSCDRYGRSVGRIKLGVRYINLEMVAEGNAWYYPDYAAGEYDLESAEKEARSKRYGLWDGKSPKAPWLWRKEKR